jgi:hypothetical protein
MTGATVWAPAETGRAELLGGCLDLGAVNPAGDPSGWERFGPPGPFMSDVDGRLVPIGGIKASSYPEVPLVSVLPAHEAELADRYARMRPAAGVFRCDLAVLGDGRLAARYADGSLLAVGPLQLAELLREFGWRGNDITLISTVTPERALGAQRHLASLAAELGCAINLAEPFSGADTTPGIGDIPVPVDLPPDPVQVDSRGRHSASALAPTDTEQFSPPGTDWAADDDSVDALNDTAVMSRFIDGPRLTTTERDAAWHGVFWLPPRLQVNDEEFDLYVECFSDPARVVAEGIPSPTLFLAGHLNRSRLAARTSADHLLQLRIRRGGAVGLGATEVTPPPAFASTLRDSDVYMLPAGWLDKSRLVGAVSVTGGAIPQFQPAEAPVLLWTDGAAHGVPGLPDDAKRWPDGRLRASATRYLLVAEYDRRGLGDWQRVYANRPDPKEGHRLLEVRIRHGLAIDVVTTAAQLEKLESVRSTAGQLLNDGVEILLPVQSFPNVTVRRVWRFRHGSWNAVSEGGGQRLADFPRT